MEPSLQFAIQGVRNSELRTAKEKGATGGARLAGKQDPKIRTGKSPLFESKDLHDLIRKCLKQPLHHHSGNANIHNHFVRIFRRIELERPGRGYL